MKIILVWEKINANLPINFPQMWALCTFVLFDKINPIFLHFFSVSREWDCTITQTHPQWCNVAKPVQLKPINFPIQGDPTRLSIVISLWQVSKSQKITKPNHFWKWYIGRFWYFDVLKAPGENNLSFRCCAKLVGLFPTRLDHTWNEPSGKPLSTTEHLKLIETYLYTPRYSHISPIHLQSCIRQK